MNTPRVLVVDYDPTRVECMLGTLANAGFDVAVARNGVDGLDAFREFAPDLVLTQMMLPKIAGLDLCRAIRKSRPNGGPSILVLGTIPADKGRSQAVAAGADGYLVAPAVPEALVETCNGYFDSHAAGRSEETRAPDGAGDAPQEFRAADGVPALVAAEILEQLDALFPSTPIDVVETPIPVDPAAGDSATLHDVAVPPPAILGEPSTRPSSAPRSEVPAPARPIPSAVPGPGSNGATLRRVKLVGALVLATGLIAMVAIARNRALPGLEHNAPEPRVDAGSATSEAGVPSVNALAGSELAGSRPGGTGEAAPIERPAEPTAVTPRHEPPRAGPRGAEPPRPGPTTPDAAPSVPSPEAEKSAAPDARTVAPEAASGPAPAPEAPPAPVDSAPESSSPHRDSSPGSTDGVGAPPTPPDAPPFPMTEVSTSPAPIRPGDFVDVERVDLPPVPTSRPAPAYPEFAKRMRLSGKVVLGLVVDETGKVTEAAPAGQGARQDFAAAAIRAVRTWTFTPATKNGVPVKTRITVRIEFNP